MHSLILFSIQSYVLLQGIDKFIITDVEEARISPVYAKPLHIIEGPLMNVRQDLDKS